MRKNDKTMKTVSRMIIALAAAALSLSVSSCADLFQAKRGIIRIDFQQDHRSLTKASQRSIDTEDYILTVHDAKGNPLYEGRFGDSPEQLEVPPGSYTVRAVSEEFTEAAFDKPQFGDTQVVVVRSGESVSVELCCRQTNCGIRLHVDESFREAFPGGTLHVSGNKGSLSYGYSESRTAFFAPGDISVSVLREGAQQALFTRTLEAQQILRVRMSASESGTSGSIRIQVDTARIWIDDEYAFGDGGASDIGNALSVTEAREHVGEKGVWVRGYLVGVASGTGRINFDPPFTRNTSVALGLRASTVNEDYCINVELKSGDIRDGLNLMDNPQIHCRQVYIKGDLVSSYYGLPGLKNVSEYQFR